MDLVFYFYFYLFSILELGLGFSVMSQVIVTNYHMIMIEDSRRFQKNDVI